MRIFILVCVYFSTGLERVDRTAVGACSLSGFSHIQKDLGMRAPHGHGWVGAKGGQLVAIQYHCFMLRFFVNYHDYTRVNQLSYLSFRP